MSKRMGSIAYLGCATILAASMALPALSMAQSAAEKRSMRVLLRDTDGDLIPDRIEKVLKLNPNKYDSNCNKVPDWREKVGTTASSVRDAFVQGSFDIDGDGIADKDEVAQGTSPYLKDSASASTSTGIRGDINFTQKAIKVTTRKSNVCYRGSRGKVCACKKSPQATPTATPTPGSTPTNPPSSTPTPRPTNTPPTATPTPTPTATPKPTATPTPTPIPSTSNWNGNVTTTAFASRIGIPSGTLGDKSRGASKWNSLLCSGCHGASPGASAQIKTVKAGTASSPQPYSYLNGAPWGGMAISKPSTQDLADLIAYMDRAAP